MRIIADARISLRTGTVFAEENALINARVEDGAPLSSVWGPGGLMLTEDEVAELHSQGEDRTAGAEGRGRQGKSHPVAPSQDAPNLHTSSKFITTLCE